MAIMNEEMMRKHKQVLSAMNDERSDWFPLWREVADYFLPRRYPWLMTQREVKTANRKNRKLLDGTSTLALRTLASGMMNGITSPARPWFRLRIAGFDEEALSHDAKTWLEETTRRLMLILAESNFYNSMAVMYIEWAGFGTASMAIYEDFDDVIRCYNFALGEFYISQDGTQRVNRHGRYFVRTVEQTVEMFGLENVCESTRQAYERKDSSLYNDVQIAHLIEQNDPTDGLLPRSDAKWREVFWELGGEAGKYLAVRPFQEWPTITPRWELLGNDAYGSSPAIDALADVKELQKLRLERANGLAKQVRPPMIVDQQLRNRPKALSAGGITYAAANNSNFGAKEAYRVNLPFQELAFDIQELQKRIKEICHNQLFNMISELDTVRSATEIDARREEKLVHLGPVLERFYNEGLDPALKRVFGIAQRSGLLPEPPEELDDTAIEVQYVSVLSDAQRAVGTVSIERFLQFAGEVSGVYPDASLVPNVEELIRDYAEGIGIKPSGVNSREDVQEAKEAEAQARGLAETAAIGKDLAQGAKVLSDADVGGGANALQAMMG